jgi:hypothetical protein
MAWQCNAYCHIELYCLKPIEGNHNRLAAWEQGGTIIPENDPPKNKWYQVLTVEAMGWSAFLVKNVTDYPEGLSSTGKMEYFLRFIRT